jgi:hypothetical protein
LEIGDISWVRILLVAGALRGRLGDRMGSYVGIQRGGRCSLGVLQGVSNVLLANCIGNLSSPTEEVKVPADSWCTAGISTAESVIVELILVVIELVAEAIIGVLEVNPGLVLAQTHHPSHRSRRRGLSRVIIFKRRSTGNLREGIRVLEETPRASGTSILVPRQGSIEAKE